LSNISTSWIQKIAIVSGDDDFQNDVAQISSKSTLKEITENIPEHNWTYVEPLIVRNASTLSVMLQNLAIEDPENLMKVGQSALRLATLWENIARLGEKTEPNFALMNSAVCYELSGYQANATCLTRKISRSLKDDANSLESLSSIFLQRLFLDLRIRCQTLLQEPTEFKGEFDAVRGLAIAAMADAYLKTVDFFLTGSKPSISEAEEQFSNAEKLFSQISCVHEFNLVRQIRSLIKIMVKSSTWNILGPILENNSVWDRYLKLLARGVGSDLLHSTSISEVWPSQKKAIESGLFDPQKNKVINMPTSAGKTRIAELAIVHTLIQNPGAKCIYVAPYRALVAELEDVFLNIFGDLGFQVSSILGTFEQDPFEEKLVENADILVLTPEKLDLLLRSKPELLDSVKLFILDEGHMIDDDSRGTKLELLLTRLKRKLTESRFLFISAVFPEDTVKEYLAWFNSNSDDEIKSDWRPSIQQHAKFEWSTVKNTGTIRYEARKENKLIDTFVSGVISQRKYRILNKNSGKYRNYTFPTASSKSNTAAELAFKFSELGPVLVFSTQKNWVQSIANALLTRLEYTKDIGEQIPRHFQQVESRSLQISKEWLGNEHPITKLLENGIAIHHATLPDILRRGIESDFREKKFRVIISTNTLAQGVNLPIKTIIIHTCRRSIERQSIRIPVSQYWNIAGRAGRAGQETEGTTIHIVNTPVDRADYKYYLDNRNRLEPVKSALLQILEQLSKGRLTEYALREKIDAEILAMLVEEGGLEQFIEKIKDILKTSLVNFQLHDDIDISTLINGFQRVGVMISQDVPENYLKTFSDTGMSSLSCLTLKEFVEKNEELIKGLINDPNSENILKLLTIMTHALSTINEMESKYSFSGDLTELLQKWIGGTNINTIISSESNENETNLAKFIENQFGYLLPWGISSFLQITQKVLNLNDEELPNEVRFLSSMVKYGVPTHEASWCMMIGIPFRPLAIKMSSKYLSQNESSEYSDFVEWISNLNSESLNQDFGLKSPFLEDVSKALFRSSVNPLLKQNKDLSSVLESPTWISGISYENRRIVAYKTKKNDVLQLERDYNNAYDRNAVKILTSNKTDLGFLNRNMAQFLAPYIDCGTKINAIITKITYDRVPNIQIQLKKIND